VYGESKAEAERRVQQLCPAALVVRTSAFFGPWDAYNFVVQALGAARAGKTFEALNDVVVSPTYIPDLVHASLDLLIDGEQGVWHLANDGAVSWCDLARKAARMAGLEHHVVGVSTTLARLAAARPACSALGSERGWPMRSLDAALEAFFAESEINWKAASSADRQPASAA
jgi:dTDP-4-dehydrorhamnose reductase